MQDEIAKAQKFHLQHFPHATAPVILASELAAIDPPLDARSEDLGYYEDGTRRTLTDEQIALFRHSEIQRLLAERRRRKDAEEDKGRQGEEYQRSRTKQKPAKAPEPSRYDDDTTVHARSDVNELSYEEGGQDAKDDEPKKFKWPVLGS